MASVSRQSLYDDLKSLLALRETGYVRFPLTNDYMLWCRLQALGGMMGAW